MFLSGVESKFKEVEMRGGSSLLSEQITLPRAQPWRVQKSSRLLFAFFPHHFYLTKATSMIDWQDYYFATG